MTKYGYKLVFRESVEVEVRKNGVIWETWCCGIGYTHMFESSAVNWAFELMRQAGFE